MRPRPQSHEPRPTCLGSAENENAYLAWKMKDPSGATCSTPCGSRCLSREKRGKRRSLCSGQWSNGTAEVGLDDYDGPKYQAESFSKTAPRVYTWKRPSGWGYTESSLPCATDGTLWESIADLPSLVKVLLSRKGDDACRG